MSQLNFNFHEKLIALFLTGLVKLIEIMGGKCANTKYNAFFFFFGRKLLRIVPQSHMQYTVNLITSRKGGGGTRKSFENAMGKCSTDCCIYSNYKGN